MKILRDSGYGKQSAVAGYGPWSGTFSAHVPNINNRNRLRIFREFIGWNTVPEGLDVIDMGGKNLIGSNLGITEFTHCNLDHELRTKKDAYDVITAFEVINHLTNHQDFLRRVHAKLKPGGRLYLSTPRPRPFWPWYPHGEGNYVEIPIKSLRKILKYTGFEIVREEVKNPWPFRFVLYGIRPPFRWLLNRFTLVECVKQEGK